MLSNTNPIHRRLLIGCSAAALVGASLAARPADAQQQAGDTEELPVLEEIIVTAQKREQTLRDVPSSVATLAGEKLDNINAAGQDIRFLAGRVPSLNIESSFGRTFPRFYIRGLGNTDFDLNASQPVSLVYDQVVMENPILKGMPAFDLARIEVLRGPQGTLFGRNTPAGIVKLESRKPSHEFDAYAKAIYGRFDTIEFEGAVGGSLIDDILAVRVSARFQHRDDYIDNVAPGNQANDEQLGGFDDFAGRAQFLLTPNDRFSALLNVHARSLEGTARLFRANIIQPGTNDLVAGFERDEISIDGRNEQDLDQRGVMLQLEYAFDPVTVTSITAFEHGEVFSGGDIDGGFGAVFAPPSGPGIIPFPSETADAVPGLDQWTQEVRVSSNELGMVDFQAGFFFFDEDLRIDSFNFNTLAGGVLNGFARQRQQATSWAVFGHADIEITPELSLQGGVRYSEDDKDFTATREQSPIGAGPIGPLTAHPDDEVISWDASVIYDATEEVTFYARAAKSFRAPSLQGRLLFGDVVTQADTEENFSIEGGIKADLFDRRARINLAGYVYDMDNQQLTAVGGGANFNRLINSADTDGAGFEFDGEWAVTSNLLLTAGVSFNFTEIDDPGLEIVACGSPCTILDPFTQVPNPFAADGDGMDEVANINGNDLPQAPRWIANWTASYTVPLAGRNEIYFFTDWAFTSEENFFLFEAAEFQSDSLLEGGVRVGYRHDGGRFDISAFGRNITDRTELQGGIDFNNLTGFLNSPPLWGIEVGARF